jgi:hypothetical protein
MALEGYSAAGPGQRLEIERLDERHEARQRPRRRAVRHLVEPGIRVERASGVVVEGRVERDGAKAVGFRLALGLGQ